MTRVIRVIDFETAGEAPPAAVIEVGWCDVVETADGWNVGSPGSGLCGADRVTCETRAVHHISPRDIEGFQPFHAQEFVGGALLDGAVALAAHNAQFEAQWLGPVLGSMSMLCTYKAALRIWPDAPAHKNMVLRYWLEEQGIANIDAALAQPAHRAGPDAYVTAHLLKHLLAKTTVEQLIAWTAEPAARQADRASSPTPRGRERGGRGRGEAWGADADPGSPGDEVP